MKNTLPTELTLKEFLLNKFKKSYIDYKDYYDRFVSVYLVFFVVTLICQAYSGYSEYGYFKKHAEIYGLPLPFYFAIIFSLIYEILKTLVTGKMYNEYFHKSIKKKNYFFICLALLLSYGSWYFSSNGIEAITRSNSIPPIDTKTSITDSTYFLNTSQLNKLKEDIKARYTYKGIFYLPIKGNKYHTQNQIDIDRTRLNQIELQLAEITKKYNLQRTLNLEEHKENRASYFRELDKDISNNRNFVLIAEVVFTVCSFFNYYFSAKSARDYQETIKNYSPPTDPLDPEEDTDKYPEEEDFEEDSITYQDHNLNGTKYRVFKNVKAEIVEPHNNVLRPVSTAVTKELTKMDVRNCAWCNTPFEKDISNDSPNKKTKKKYCSDHCLNEARKHKTYERRRREKEEKLKQEQDGLILKEDNLNNGQTSIIWQKKTGTNGKKTD